MALESIRSTLDQMVGPEVSPYRDSNRQTKAREMRLQALKEQKAIYENPIM